MFGWKNNKKADKRPRKGAFAFLVPFLKQRAKRDAEPETESIPRCSVGAPQDAPEREPDEPSILEIADTLGRTAVGFMTGFGAGFVVASFVWAGLMLFAPFLAHTIAVLMLIGTVALIARKGWAIVTRPVASIYRWATG